MTRSTALTRLLATLLATVVALGGLVATGSAAQAKSSGLTVKKIANARVPSLCGHKAGRLVNGKLPGISENNGGVWLDKKKIAFGKLRKGQARSAAAVVGCNQGGVGWPDNVVVYSPKRKIIGTFRLGSITHGAREHVRKLWIKKRVLHVQVANITGPDDALCCGTWSADLTMKWSGKKGRMVLKSKRIYTERATGVNLVGAVEGNKRSVALKYGSAAVVDRLIGLRAAGADLRPRGCYGELSDEYGVFSDYDVFAQVSGSYGRTCRVDAVYSTGNSVPYFLFFDQPGWKTWKVADIW